MQLSSQATLQTVLINSELSRLYTLQRSMRKNNMITFTEIQAAREKMALESQRLARWVHLFKICVTQLRLRATYHVYNKSFEIAVYTLELCY